MRRRPEKDDQKKMQEYSEIFAEHSSDTWIFGRSPKII